MGCFQLVWTNPTITLTSAAFAGCALTAGPSTFPDTITLPGAGVINNTVTGSLVSSSLQLTARWLGNGPSGDPGTRWTASWQLSGCPAVSPRVAARVGPGAGAALHAAAASSVGQVCWGPNTALRFKLEHQDTSSN